MKLINRDDSQLTFQVGKRERELIFELLRRYPVLSGAHFSARPGQTSKKDLELLEEALAEQQKENRRQLERMLQETGRFNETDLGFSFTLSPPEVEWLLQVLNDIRVGSWIHLGQPGLNSTGSIEVTEANVQMAWAMEMAGLFEHVLLEAVKSA